jgi:hypothetical protein
MQVIVIGTAWTVEQYHSGADSNQAAEADATE